MRIFQIKIQKDKLERWKRLEMNLTKKISILFLPSGGINVNVWNLSSYIFFEDTKSILNRFST